MNPHGVFSNSQAACVTTWYRHVLAVHMYAVCTDWKADVQHECIGPFGTSRGLLMVNMKAEMVSVEVINSHNVSLHALIWRAYKTIHSP